jgi:hypothetical protein
MTFTHAKAVHAKQIVNAIEGCIAAVLANKMVVLPIGQYSFPNSPLTEAEQAYATLSLLVQPSIYAGLFPYTRVEICIYVQVCLYLPTWGRCIAAH